jgi:hypothetical protein
MDTLNVTANPLSPCRWVDGKSLHSRIRIFSLIWTTICAGFPAKPQANAPLQRLPPSPDGASPALWQNLLATLSQADALAATLPPSKNKFGIVPKLRGAWLAAANDNSPEFRLATAFASQDRIRRHFLPLNKFGNQLDEKGAVSVV